MISSYQDQKQWLNQYTSMDLSRTLVREYLFQHNMFKTLNCFEKQDKQNSKKIVKSTVIKMLCINNLVVNNKNLDKDKQCNSLLVLLTQYLRGKFEQRIVREERSDSQSQGQQLNKEFSMNGDKVLPISKQSNRIKEKNLVSTKRAQNINQKTLTQQAFYKKKDMVKHQQPIQLSKKTSNNITAEEKKLAINNRPSTAKPTLGQKKEEKKEDKKVSEIYSKLNTNVRENKPEDKVFEEDPLAVDIKGIKGNRKQQQLKIKQVSARNTNNAIERKSNNLISQTSESTQNNTKAQSTQLEQKQQQYIKQQNNNKWNTQVQQLKQQKSLHSIHSQRKDKQQQSGQKKKQLVEEYFDEFQQETKPEVKVQKEHVVKHVQLLIEKTNKVQVKLEDNKLLIAEQKVIATEVKPIYISPPQQQVPAKNVQVTSKSLSSKPQIHQTKFPNQTQQPYQPSSNPVSRGGMKLLKRTTKPLSKDQEATELIGHNIKLLPDDINPSTQDLSIQNHVASNKPNDQLNIKSKSHNNVSEQIKNYQPQKQQKQQPLPQTSVRQIKLKKKLKPAQEQPIQTTKFKFDDNFIDQPLNGIKEKYTYEKFIFNQMTIKPQLKPKNSNFLLQTKIDHTQKPSAQGSNPYAQKKKNQKPLSTQKAQELKNILFQKGSPYLPKAWHQGFILSPFGDTFYGLKQIQGGPCGIIAAVQCFFLKHLMYLSKPTCQNDLKNETRRQSCLISALTDILWKAKGLNNDKITLVIPTNRNFSGPKLEFSSLTQVEIQAPTFQSAYEAMWNYKSSFIGQANHGVIVIIYSIIMTKGIDKIYQEVDMKENPLIGHHGHCTQELVNLFITGQASSNCFDGKQELQENFTLHGIDQKSQFGFLTVYETLEYIEVGKNLKNPIFPIWIISKEFHYHVIFGNHYLISENNDCAKFDLIYFDGLYACDKFIRLTFDDVEKDQFGMVKDLGKIKDLPLIQQVLLKKWGRRKVDWNGSIKIL